MESITEEARTVVVVGLDNDDFCRSSALKTLERMACLPSPKSDCPQRLDLGVIATEGRSPEMVRREVIEWAPDTDAFITMPTRGGYGIFDAETLSEARDGLVIGTISASSAHIDLDGVDGVNVISCENGGNADSVAEAIITKIVLALRPIHESYEQARSGKLSNRLLRESERISGKCCLLIGSGNVASRLLPKLVAYTPHEIRICSPNFDEFRLNRILAGVVGWDADEQSVETPLSEEFQTTISGPHGASIKIVGGRELSIMLPDSNIIVIVANIADDPTERPILTLEHFQSLEGINPVIINASRAHAVDYGAVISAIEQSRITYITDVLISDAEQSGLTADDPIGALYMNKSLDLPLKISPHIDGTTLDAFESNANEIVQKILLQLYPNLQCPKS